MSGPKMKKHEDIQKSQNKLMTRPFMKKMHKGQNSNQERESTLINPMKLKDLKSKIIQSRKKSRNPTKETNLM